MQHLTTTPFGRRPVNSGLVAANMLRDAPVPADVPDKWTILKNLTAARAVYGISDRDLAVLTALASFHPGAALTEGDGTIVFPSNAALSERTHGMAESTLRRHLAALVTAGLILRHDSPNGKRYAARDGVGGPVVAFGFDLRPLLVRSAEIGAAATAAREAAARQRRLREAAVLRLRDAAKLITYGREAAPGDWDALEDQTRLLQHKMRRKLDTELLEEMNAGILAVLEAISVRLDPQETEEMDGNAAANERHIQYSTIDSPDSEPSLEKEEASAEAPSPDPAEPRLPLFLVLKACPDLLDYVPGGIRHWHELVAAADFVHPMLGVSVDAWARARRAMGDPVAAITLACILQRATEIRSPGGYLRALTGKAEAGAFSPGPMVMALIGTENARAV
ncbi:MAG: replication initiation protein RepC [Proteobacteria bacterium]|nr:replication initiation protein RepC [Pseudomonadota bacterium]